MTKKTRRNTVLGRSGTYMPLRYLSLILVADRNVISELIVTCFCGEIGSGSMHRSFGTIRPASRIFALASLN